MSNRPTPIPIPISSLFPPPSSSSSSSSSNPESRPGPFTSYFGRTTYIIGELPPTTPIHLSLNHLSLLDNQPIDHPSSDIPANRQSSLPNRNKGKGKEIVSDETIKSEYDAKDKFKVKEVRSKERILIITSQKGNFIDSIKDQDEDFFREHSGYWEVLKRLKRIDIRYCPTPSHLKLLLILLTESDFRLNTKSQPQYLDSVPSIIIFWDIAGMFMDEDKIDENEPPQNIDNMPTGEDESNIDMNAEGSGRKFKSGICISDYMDFLSSTKATMEHLNTLHPSDPPTQLIILEPSLNPFSSLPILPPLSSENEDPKMPKSARERKVSIIDGARWMFGKDSIGIIHRLSGEQNSSNSYFSLTFEKDKEKSYQLKKKKCPKADYSVPNFEGQVNKSTGWRWEWVSS